MIQFLIIEDEFLDMKRICEHLEKRFPGSVLVCLTTAESGKQVSNIDSYTAIFVNLKLDGISDAGIGLIEQYRGMSADKPIFVVSGANSEAIKLKAFMAGATGFLQKDFGSIEGMQVAQTIDEHIAVHAKGVEKGKSMKSWKTSSASIGSAMVVLGSILTDLTDGNPATNPNWAVMIPLLLTAVGGMFARDHSVSDEQAGAGRTKP